MTLEIAGTWRSRLGKCVLDCCVPLSSAFELQRLGGVAALPVAESSLQRRCSPRHGGAQTERMLGVQYMLIGPSPWLRRAAAAQLRTVWRSSLRAEERVLGAWPAGVAAVGTQTHLV